MVEAMYMGVGVMNKIRIINRTSFLLKFIFVLKHGKNFVNKFQQKMFRSLTRLKGHKLRF